jgi:hypothetical protein
MLVVPTELRRNRMCFRYSTLKHNQGESLDQHLQLR